MSSLRNETNVGLLQRDRGNAAGGGGEQRKQKQEKKQKEAALACLEDRVTGDGSKRQMTG